MQPTAKAWLIDRLVGFTKQEKDQTILAAKEKPPTVAYWESAYLRRLAGLNILAVLSKGCLMQTSQKSGIAIFDIFD